MEKCEKAKLSTFFKIFYLSFQNRIRHKHQNLNENIEKEKKNAINTKDKDWTWNCKKNKVMIISFLCFFQIYLTIAKLNNVLSNGWLLLKVLGMEREKVRNEIW